MRRLLVPMTAALALSLAPATIFAQTQPPTGQPPTGQPPTGQPPTGQPPTGQPPTGQPPTGQPPAGQPPAGAQTPAEGPRLSFDSDAGILLVQIKPDQTAVFDELVLKLKAALAKSTDPARKQQASSWKIYKANEPMANNTLYIFLLDPAVKGAEYDLFKLIQEGLGAEVTADMYKKYADSFATGLSKLTLVPMGTAGGM